MFEQTNIAVGAICGGSVVVRSHGQCWGACGLSDARQLVTHPTSGWYAPSTKCACGDEWAEGELMPRPFRRGWRQEAQRKFEKAWAAAHPEGVRPVYDEDAMFVGLYEGNTAA